MSNKNILITGAASGIGKGIAEFLANRGNHIIVTDLNLDAAVETADSIKQSGGSAVAFKLDVSSQSDIDTLCGSLNCSVDVLINNAGIQHVEALESFPMEKWNQLIQILLVGVARLTQAVIPSMQENDFGRVINIGSIHALVASPFKSAYVAAKHGLLGFSKTLSLEVAAKNITVNTLCPAYVRTPLVDKQIAAQAKEHGLTEQQVVEQIMLKPMPKKAFIEIEELAGCCEFLMSDYAKNITAQTIVLDGGWTAQ
ncbi:MAG: 3-hydroxybutyrate dehydrogenase [Kangiellaceae bacterium]|nr:3-hydroxybutyrate dehydrogenase [Kangiellaceae bacterium]